VIELLGLDMSLEEAETMWQDRLDVKGLGFINRRTLQQWYVCTAARDGLPDAELEQAAAAAAAPEVLRSGAASVNGQPEDLRTVKIDTVASAAIHARRARHRLGSSSRGQSEMRKRRQATIAAENAFRVCDNDSNGVVNYDEFKDLLYTLGMEKPDEELLAICHDLDRDNDGGIDREEFVQWFVKLQLNAALDLSSTKNIEVFVDHIFSIIDTDKSNHITTEELLVTLKTLGQGDLSYEDVREIVADLDRDASGGIDRSEFVAYIKEHADFI